jgi:uncharacterized protein YjbI with pentapeptide repeats
MKTIKPQKLGVLCRTFENGDECYFAVSALVFFPFAPATTLLPEVELWKLAASELGDEPLDVCMPKQRGEVLVTGSAYPFGGARPVCAPRVAVGTVDKSLYVVGDRFWKGSAASDPRPFDEMPITYERAFGGEGYAPNPVGKGFLPTRTEHGEVHFLPNVEHPKHLLRSPSDRPQPAGFGAYDFTWPQRFSKVGTYDAAWLRERFPGFARDLDWSLWNAAPEDQQIAGYFEGDEPFTVEYMHREKARIEGRLPGVRARAFITRKAGAAETFLEIPMRLDTLRLFPHAERGVLVFHGMVEVAEDDGADVLHLVLGCEDLGAPKPVEHYREVLAQRLDRTKGPLLAFRDGDLMPAREGPVAASAADDPDMSMQGLLQKNARRRLEIEHEQAKARMIALGVDPAKVALPPLPPEEPPPNLAELPAALERATADADKLKAEAEGRLAEAERQVRAMCAAQGLDYDHVVREARAKAGGPPKFSLSEELPRMRLAAEQAKALGITSPEIDAVLSDASLEERLRAVDRRMQEAYQRFAHQFPEAARLEGDQAARVRREVAAGHRAGRSFAGCDLTGADLSGLDLTRADFKDALLEHADLTGSELCGADFTGAVLARANLTRANLFAAKLAGANLGCAKLVDAEVGGGAVLDGAVLAKADLTGARFHDAEMARADLMEATLTGADFTRARAAEVNFIKTDLTGVKLAGADMHKSIFIEAVVAGVDFSGSKLASAVFLAARGDRAVFREADLTNLRVVKESSFEGGDFKGARLDGANLRGTRLAGSDFSGAHLDGADLSECDLRGARFYRASARGAQLVRADLTRAVMTSINLMEGSLQKAILAGADLRGANLFRVDFAKTRADAATNLKDANVKHVRVVPPRRGQNAAR